LCRHIYGCDEAGFNSTAKIYITYHLFAKGYQIEPLKIEDRPIPISDYWNLALAAKKQNTGGYIFDNPVKFF
jgi:hypothetical protein